MRKIHTSAINRKLGENDAAFVKKCDEEYFSQIKAMAEMIYERGDSRPIVLLSGPSGSGKTTTALKLEEYLDERGMRTHTISMDGYFLPVDRSPKALTETGEVDYESPYRLDIPLLNEHMMKIANCEEICLPQFDFKTQSRVKGDTLKRQHGDIVIFEGIHALNPDVTGMSDEIANCVYVSVRTRLQLKNGACLHPCMIRLMRRIIRDRSYRGRELVDTLALFDSVERGENLYIMPHKHRAEFNIDTFFAYEVPLYKSLIYDDVLKLSQSGEDFEKFDMILKVLEEIDSLDKAKIPENSLIREFVGGSSYKY